MIQPKPFRRFALLPLAALALVPALGACRSTERSAAPGAAHAMAPSVAPRAEREGEGPETTAMRLALAPSRGTAAVDQLIAQLQTSARRNPQKPDYWLSLGEQWIRKARETSDPGFYLNAGAAADVVLASAPDDKLALDLKGLVLLNDHRFAEARAVAEKVAAKHPEDVMAFGNVADAALEMGDFVAAERAVDTMMTLKPGLPAYSRAAHLRWLRGETREALEDARLAIDAGRDAKNPEPGAWVLVQTADLFWHRGDVGGAEAGYDKALSWVAEYPPALVGKGRVAMARGEFARAADFFQRAHAKSPLVQTAWLLGDARARAGDAKGASEAWAIAERDGRASDPRTLSLFYSTKNEKAADALALAETDGKTRDDLYTEDARAWALYRSGRLAEAKTAIDRASSLGTPDARIVYHAGAIRLALGDVDAGKKLVGDALALNPAFDVDAADEARALLASHGAKPAAR